MKSESETVPEYLCSKSYGKYEALNGDEEGFQITKYFKFISVVKSVY